MTEWDSYYDTANQASDSLDTFVSEQMPEVEEWLRCDTAPVVRLDCPRGHRIIDARLEGDHNWHLWVVDAAGDPLGLPADPLSSGHVRITLSCPKAKCKASSTLTGGRLLKVYLAAACSGLRSIRLSG